jgi:hypothetical protein
MPKQQLIYTSMASLLSLSEYNLLTKNAVGHFAGTSPVLYNSPLGTPVFSDLSIQGDNYMLDGLQKSFTDIDEMSALFVVDQKKIIKRTPINQRNGRVKEYIGLDDFEIKCAIRLLGPNLKYPQDFVNNFILMLNCNKSLHVNSWYLNQFGIYDIVISDYSSPQTAGTISEQIISFNAWSDRPLILQFQ